MLVTALLAPCAFAAAGELTATLPMAAPAAEGLAPARLEALNARLRRVVDEGQSAGFVTLVARHGRIVDWRTYGRRDLSANLPMEKDTIFRIASMSKIVTSVGVLMLFEDGRLRLDDPVEKYLPALKDRQVLAGGTFEHPQLVPAATPVTIRQLLSHTSGYIYDFGGEGALERFYRKADVFSAPDGATFVQRAATLPLAVQPGTAFRYGISTDILGAVIEAASGQPIDAFLQERIFAPLGMVDTGFAVPADRRGRVAKVYRRDASGGLVEALHSEPERVSFPSCGGGLFSTAADYFRFAQMLANGGELNGTRLLGRKTVELMTQNQLQGLATPYHAYSRSRGYGLGVEVLIDLAHSDTLGSVGQFGWAGANTTLCQIDPREQLVMLAFFQHVPMNETGVFALFTTGAEAALVDAAPVGLSR